MMNVITLNGENKLNLSNQVQFWSTAESNKIREVYDYLTHNNNQ